MGKNNTKMRVCEYFAGKEIFLTGGTGFVGKELIEKLLRSCPDVGNIYVLIRCKKGKTAQERLEKITENPLFDKLKEAHPNNLKKLIAIEGDVAALGLGISAENRKMLTERVNIIYSSAASVRFDDPLKEAILVNVRSTREIIKLALETKNLSVFIHVSTTYCNVDKMLIEEKIYPSHGNWKDAIKFVEEADDNLVKTMTQKYIHPLPNTYTYAKSLAEHTVLDMCTGKIPAIIVRPAVVISTIEEPFPGWNDNLNGPVGLLVAGGKGLLRICYGNGDGIQDYIPVDFVTKLLIVGAYVKSQTGNNEEIEVYNGSKYIENPVTTREMLNMGARLIWDVPFEEIMWYPRFSITSCFYSYYFQVLMFHMIPAFFIDILLRIIGRKPIIFTLQRKIYIANCVLEYFIRYNWLFDNKKTFELLDKLLPEDHKDFHIPEGYHTMSKTEIYNYYRCSALGAAKYMFKETSSLEDSRRNTKRLWMIDIMVKLILGTLFLWYIFTRYDVITFITDPFVNYVKRL